MALTDAERQAAYRLRNPYQTKTLEIIVDGKKYVFSAPQAKPGTRKLLKKLIKGINKWKNNPTSENWNAVFREAKPFIKGKPQQYQYGWSTHLRNYLQGKPVESSVAKGIFDQSNIKKLLNLSENEVSKIKGLHRSSITGCSIRSGRLYEPLFKKGLMIIQKS